MVPTKISNCQGTFNIWKKYIVRERSYFCKIGHRIPKTGEDRRYGRDGLAEKIKFEESVDNKMQCG